MRSLVGMWRRPRLVGTGILVALVYAGLLVPFKSIVIIPSLTTVRPANFVPVVAGLLFGPAGAVGAAIGNLIGDFFGGTWNAVSPYGALANFLGAYVPYRLWGRLGPLSTGDRPDFSTADHLVEYVVVVLASSSVLAAVLGWGMAATGTLLFAPFAMIVFASNAVVALVFGPPVLYALYYKIEARGLLASQLLRQPEGPSGTERRAVAATYTLAGVGVAWFLLGTAYSVILDGATLFVASPESIGAPTSDPIQTYGGAFALGTVAVLDYVAGPRVGPTGLETDGTDGPTVSLSPIWCLYAVGFVLAAAFFLSVRTKLSTLSPSALGVVTLFCLGPAALLGVAGRWLDRRGYSSAAVWRVTLWAVGGTAAFTILFGTWQFYLGLLGPSDPPQALQTVLVSSQIGSLVGLAVGVYDARARRRRRQSVETNERLALLNRAIRHDLRNRIQVVGGRAELLADDGSEHAEEIMAAVADVTDLTDRAREVTERALHRDQNVEAVPIRPVVRSQVRTVRAHHGGSISLRGGVPDASVAAGELLPICVEQLLRSAIDDDRSSVEISVWTDEAHVVLCVTDASHATAGGGRLQGIPHGGSDVAAASDGDELYLTRILADRYGGELSVSDGDDGRVVELALQRQG